MNQPLKDTAFYKFIDEHFNKGTFTNDDVIAIMIPLLKNVVDIHHQGKVAMLHELSSIYIDNLHFKISNQALDVKLNTHRFQHYFRPKSSAFEITGEIVASLEIGDEVNRAMAEKNVSDANSNDERQPIYLLDYKCFELAFDHHDPLTDIFILGMILASLSLGLDFTNVQDLKKFVEYRKQLYNINTKIHPAIANIIFGMTALDRNKRWKDLNEIIEKLQNYRDYNPEVEYDLSKMIDEKSKNRNQFIHEKLRNRLFDNSRRNRLLYFQPNLKFLNLTISSVPQLLNYQNIDPSHIFYWNEEISKKISNTSSISLNKYLRIEDNPYIVPTLDKIRLESNKDVNEYGFSQLKLALCNLNWYNTKENGTEKIVSPLLLASVTLAKKKGLKDQYTLEFTDSDVEINPVLANMLKDLYDIRLPDRVQLSDFKIEDIYNLLKAQIEKTNSGIVLDHIDKPKIKLIYSQAKQILTQFNKRTKAKVAIKDLRNIGYSYQQENFQPYGLELFRNYVFTQASSLEYLINSDIQTNPHFYNENNHVEREFYQLDEGESNPFRWEFDCCNLILGNFNYKKMSLVRDYNHVIENGVENDVFRSLFNALAQKSFKTEVKSENTFTKTFNVVASDPTQNNAVKYSETGQSYIIQGPPGTGKSQTIANLIANYVANGKKVLFVCEKRAALDVVFYRLKNQALDDLCCLIHDSQADKKEFIFNLRETFNEFTNAKNNFQQVENSRNNLVAQIETEINKIGNFHNFMNTAIAPGSAHTIKHLFDILISNPYKAQSSHLEQLDDSAGYADWKNLEYVANRLFEINKETNQSEYFSNHPFQYLRNDAFDQFTNLSEFKNQLESVLNTIENCIERLEFIQLPSDIVSFADSHEFLKKVKDILPFFDHNIEGLLDNNSSLFQSFEQDINELQRLKEAKDKLAKQFPYWTKELPETDAKTAFQIIQNNESSFFNFLNSSYKQAKKQVLSIYDIGKHTVKPSLTSVLENICKQHDLANQIENIEADSRKKYKIGSIFEIKNMIANYQNPSFREVVLLAQKLSIAERNDITELNDLFHNSQQILSKTLDDFQHLSLTNIEKILNDIDNKKSHYDLYATVFEDFRSCHPSVIKLLKKSKINIEQLQVTLAEKSLEKYYSIHYFDKKHNMDSLHVSIQKIKMMYAELMEINGKYIVSKQISKLKELILQSELSTAGMTSQEKDKKKSITDGRKILENEFSKTIRFKSIRELASSDSGQIIREIKPIWLMSPLSVSDTLPLDSGYFDVVIFDEASQITLEEGLVPIYRASQTIIVGDEMQMPPSNFFGSGSGNQDDLWSDPSGDENDYFSLDADSFLTQGARKFPSIMLGWHYRSKHESLIGFSNASFYDNKLLTIPDLKDHSKTSDEIIVTNVNEAQTNYTHIISKPISYHYIDQGVYLGRSNVKEAMYIAHLVKELLTHNLGQSIGIVAFSMEQQNEIETAIGLMCIKDKVFENILEEEYKRVENNQFVGLFVKNLENVQGDERDIIIMSTCYGYGPNGKMLMNFGPINKRGGEKRLNVIFSRAKKSMCVVSSIKYYDIKNEYNEGANYFRKYLQYAELVSLGQIESANNVLSSINNKNSVEPTSQITNQIENELLKLGYYCNQNIGQSKFKCHLGVKKSKQDEEYILGIVIDDNIHYSNDDILEQYLLRPEILKSNGWNISQIYAKDWLENKPRVLQMITSMLTKEAFFDPIIVDRNTDVEIDVAEIEVQEEVQNDFQRYINTANGSSKFWEICNQDNTIIIQYGRIGSKGQRMVKVFDTAFDAQREMLKLIAQKVTKDYTKE